MTTTTRPTAADVLRQAREALAYYATAGKAGELCSGDIATDALAAIDALPSAPAVAWHMRVIGCDGSADWCELGAGHPEVPAGVEALPLVYAQASAPSGEPVMVDYAALLQAAEARKYKQGTGACIAFKQGAEWQAAQAAPAPQAATASVAGISKLDPNEDDPGRLWAEIARLCAALKGPDGYATWQDAATAERVRRVRAERAAPQAVPVPALSDYLDGVNIPSLINALVWLGYATEGHEATGARLAFHVNNITSAVLRHKDLFRAPPAAAAPEPVAHGLKQTFSRSEVIAAIEAERHACSIAVWMAMMDSQCEDADDLGLVGWMREAEARIKRRSAADPEVQTAPAVAATVQGLTDDALRKISPYRHSGSSLSVWINGFRAAERAHGIATPAPKE